MVPPVFPLLNVAAVTALVGTSPVRVYRSDYAPQDTPRPYVTWSTISAVPAQGFDLPDIDNARVQVNCFADTSPARDALAKAVQVAMENGGVNVMISDNGDSYDQPTNLYRQSMDFSLWVNR